MTDFATPVDVAQNRAYIAVFQVSADCEEIEETSRMTMEEYLSVMAGMGDAWCYQSLESVVTEREGDGYVAYLFLKLTTGERGPDRASEVMAEALIDKSNKEQEWVQKKINLLTRRQGEIKDKYKDLITYLKGEDDYY